MKNKSSKEVEKESGYYPEKEVITNMECQKLPEKPKPIKKVETAVINEKTEKTILNKKAENEIDVIDLEGIVNTENASMPQDQENTLFSPQQLKSEVTLGNATYVITTILDLPGSTLPKGDTKTNGLNADATSPDSNKIDIMNAVQLQKVPSKKDFKEQNKTDS